MSRHSPCQEAGGPQSITRYKALTWSCGLTFSDMSATLTLGAARNRRTMMESMASKESGGAPSLNMPFCPFCFMQQFDVTEASEGSVYCEVCGIDIPVRELVKL
jgi:hypothetical protein